MEVRAVRPSLDDIMKKFKIPHIATDDELRNVICFLYLRNVAEILKRIPRDDNTLTSDPVVNEVMGIDTYSARRFGDLYTRFYTTVAERLQRSAENGSAGKEANSHWLEPLVRSLYDNDNYAMELSGQLIADYRARASKPQHIHEKNPLNEHTPSLMNTAQLRLASVFSSHYRPQSITSIPSIVHYDYLGNLVNPPQQHRLGTQGEIVNNKIQINPLFEAWIELQEKERRKPTPITHVYFNGLALHRPWHSLEGRRETKITGVLHQFGEKHSNIAVITLPSDKRLMDPHLFQNKEKISSEAAFMDMFEIANGDRDNEDFHISERDQQLLFGTTENRDIDQANKRKILFALLKESFTEMGLADKLADNQEITMAEQQAVFYYFIKFQLTDFTLTKLQPDHVHWACKDGIDRKALAAALYNVMKSIKSGQILSEEEFLRAVHGPAMYVKGREMNDHKYTLWNVLNLYNKANPQTPPEPGVAPHSPERRMAAASLPLNIQRWVEKNTPPKPTWWQRNKRWVVPVLVGLVVAGIAAALAFTVVGAVVGVAGVAVAAGIGIAEAAATISIGATTSVAAGALAGGAIAASKGIDNKVKAGKKRKHNDAMIEMYRTLQPQIGRAAIDAPPPASPRPPVEVDAPPAGRRIDASRSPVAPVEKDSKTQLRRQSIG